MGKSPGLHGRGKGYIQLIFQNSFLTYTHTQLCIMNSRMWVVSVSAVDGGSGLHQTDDSCESWHRDWTKNTCQDNHWTPVFLGSMKIYATLYVGRGREMRKHIPRHWSPKPDAKFKCCLTRVFPSLFRDWDYSHSRNTSHGLSLQDQQVPSPQVSSHVDNLRPRSWWYSLFTHQLPLLGQCTSQPKEMFLVFV